MANTIIIKCMLELKPCIILFIYKTNNSLYEHSQYFELSLINSTFTT